MNASLYDRYPQLNSIKTDIEAAADMLIECYKNGGKILVCGNGGSAADSEHIVGELLKGFTKKRPLRNSNLPDYLANNLQQSLPAISIPSQSAILSAVLNDIGGEFVYAQVAFGLTNPGDVLIGISTSGNAKNVLNAGIVAKNKGAKVLALTGESGSKISELADITIKAPETETYKVQELHLPIYHYLCAKIEDYFFNE